MIFPTSVPANWPRALHLCLMQALHGRSDRLGDAVLLHHALQLLLYGPLCVQLPGKPHRQGVVDDQQQQQHEEAGPNRL